MAFKTDDPAFEAGREMRRKLYGDEAVARFDATDDFHEPLEDYVNRAVFGETWSRPGLTIRERAFITIAVTAALNRKLPLERQIVMAVNNGATKDDIKEVLLHTTMYIGVAGGVESWATAADTLKAIGKY
jgi:4-carboxymuconolactone decarboxylase